MYKVNKIQNWKRNIDFIKVNFFILYKRTVEYKSNLYSSIILESIWFCSIFFFFTILNDNFKGIIGWSLHDFMLYSALIALISGIGGLIMWKNSLFVELKKGKLNSYLIRPINPSLFFAFFKMAPPALVMLCIDTILVVFLILYFKIRLHNIILSLMIFCLIILFNIYMQLFMFSFDFHKMGISSAIIEGYSQIKYSFEHYPAQFFENTKFNILGYAVSFYYGGLLLLPTLRGYEINNFWIHMSVLITSIILLMILNNYSWKKGLKKYEAFG